jgi:cell wall-associated NlpC family hydrolase
MLCARALRSAAVITAALLLLTPVTPAIADNDDPTPTELRAAQERITRARQAVGSQQSRATQAVEAYNGAQVRAQAAVEARQRAAVATRTAHARAAAAEASADQAQAEALAAAAAAEAAHVVSVSASEDAIRSQLAFDRMVVGAFQSGGKIGALSQLMLSRDPIALANGRQMMDHVAAYQQQVIREMEAARTQARTAEDLALDTQQEAVSSAKRAATILAAAQRARAAAVAADAVAADAAAEATRLLSAARAARSRAQLLVRQAERDLGRAVLTGKALQKAAAAARAKAADVPRSSAPSDAAGIAIRWAYEQIGIPYSWGGGDKNGPTRGFAQGANTVGFDCSGLTLFIYGKAGIHLDHWTGSQYYQGKRVATRAELQPGDLMFFADDTSNPATIHHVALYIGNDRLIEAPYTGEVVRVASANRSDFIGGTRPWAVG